MNGWLEPAKPLIHVLVHPKESLSTYYMSGTVLDTKDSA